MVSLDYIIYMLEWSGVEFALVFQHAEFKSYHYQFDVFFFRKNSETLYVSALYKAYIPQRICDYLVVLSNNVLQAKMRLTHICVPRDRLGLFQFIPSRRFIYLSYFNKRIGHPDVHLIFWSCRNLNLIPKASQL